VAQRAGRAGLPDRAAQAELTCRRHRRADDSPHSSPHAALSTARSRRTPSEQAILRAPRCLSLASRYSDSKRRRLRPCGHHRRESAAPPRGATDGSKPRAGGAPVGIPSICDEFTTTSWQMPARDRVAPGASVICVTRSSCPPVMLAPCRCDKFSPSVTGVESERQKSPPTCGTAGAHDRDWHTGCSPSCRTHGGSRG
jgi:hypothetical protein